MEHRFTQGNISVIASVLADNGKKMCVYMKIKGEERIVAEVILTDTNEAVISFAIPVTYGTLSYQELRDISDIMQDIEFLRKNEVNHQKDRP